MRMDPSRVIGALIEVHRALGPGLPPSPFLIFPIFLSVLSLDASENGEIAGRRGDMLRGWSWIATSATAR